MSSNKRKSGKTNRFGNRRNSDKPSRKPIRKSDPRIDTGPVDALPGNQPHKGSAAISLPPAADHIKLLVALMETAAAELHVPPAANGDPLEYLELHRAVLDAIPPLLSSASIAKAYAKNGVPPGCLSPLLEALDHLQRVAVDRDDVQPVEPRAGVNSAVDCILRAKAEIEAASAIEPDGVREMRRLLGILENIAGKIGPFRVGELVLSPPG